MYHDYFGLKEQAFSIAVNPRYLYMSAQHKEALAHLLYGVKGGGFVMLSGEVGTGKTTIIRCLLDQLPENTDIAIVMNPMANVPEMLSSICDELGVEYYNDEITVKSLTDALQDYLLTNHTKGNNTVLLIDEAQLLSPDALEQIRLLTNLETTTQKLLQIVLVGQPELNELLSQPRLRQLSQRITARFHLKPLTVAETESYISHRLSVAGMPEGRNPFPSRVVKKIHGFTGGIPRLINILCERMLIGAYGHNKQRVDNDIFRQACQEVVGGETPPNVPDFVRAIEDHWRLFAAGAASMGVLLAAVFFVLWIIEPSDDSPSQVIEQPVATQPKTIDSPASTTPTQAMPSTVAQISDNPPLVSPPDAVVLADNKNHLDQDGQYSIKDYTKAQEVLLRFLKYPVESETHPCWKLVRQEVKCQNTELETWDDLKELNRPAVLTLTTPDKFVSYVVLIGINSTHALLLDDSNQRRIEPLSDIGRAWTGKAFYVWHKPRGFSEPIGTGSQGRTVTWVAEQFAVIDGQPDPLTEKVFNNALKQRIKMFQRENGLEADGIIGANTLMKLNERLGLDAVLEVDFDIQTTSDT